MKNIKLLTFFAIAINSCLIMNASDDESNRNYQKNRESMHEALTFAIQMRQEFEGDFLTIALITPPFTNEQQLACRLDYERLNPNIFHLNPTIIARQNENAISIRVFSRAQCDALMSEAATQRRNG